MIAARLRGGHRRLDLHRQPDGGGKLQDLLPGAPITYTGQNVSNFTLLAVWFVVSFIVLVIEPTACVCSSR